MSIIKLKFPDLDEVAISVIAEEWVRRMALKIKIFHQAQMVNFQVQTEHSFYRRYGLQEGDSISEADLIQEWSDWNEISGLNACKAETEHRVKVIENIENSLKTHDRSRKSMSLLTISEVWEMPIYKYNDELVLRTHAELDKFWFDDITKPNKNEQANQLPYPEYLQSPRWLRLRAAMILLMGARCQHSECMASGDSWYGGDEPDLNVHHLTYENIGKESFDDLQLLCRRHHEAAHEQHAP